MSHPLFAAKAPVVMRNLMADFPGLTLIDAAAILGNLGHECAGFTKLQELHPVVAGSRGGYGWAQWTGSRRRVYEAWCAARQLDPASDAANYGYLVLELRGPEKAAITALREADGLPGKVHAFERGFLRAGTPHYASRNAWAAEALAAAKAVGAAVESVQAAPAVRASPDAEPVPAPAPATGNGPAAATAGMAGGGAAIMAGLGLPWQAVAAVVVLGIVAAVYVYLTHRKG